MKIRLLAILLLCSSASMAQGDTCRWTDDSLAGTNWSDSWNWSDWNVPSDGDDLVIQRNVIFTHESSRPDIHNNLPSGNNYRKISFGGQDTDDEGAWHVTGNGIRVTEKMYFSRADAVLEPKFTAAHSNVVPVVSIQVVGVDVSLNGGIHLDDDLDVSVSDLGRFQVPNVISGGPGNDLSCAKGTYGMVADPVNYPDTEAAVFGGSNTFDGDLTVRGELVVASNGALGSTVGGTNVLQSGIPLFINLLRFKGVSPLTLGERLSVGIDCTLRSEGAGVVLTGLVDAQQIEVNAPLTLREWVSTFGTTVTTTVPGPGAVLTLSGSAANTLFEYSPIRISKVKVLLAKSPGVDAFAGPLKLILDDAAELLWVQDNQIADGMNLSLQGATANLDGRDETIATLLFEAPVTGDLANSVETGIGGSLRINHSIQMKPGAGASTIGGELVLGNASTGVIAGNLDRNLVITANVTQGVAGAVLHTLGPGSVQLQGICSAPAYLDSGTLIVTSTSSGMAVTLAGGILTGTGTVGALSSPTFSGAIAPGSSEATGVKGILRTGTMAFDSEVDFKIDLTGSTPGTGHDQLQVTGQVNLANANLVVETGTYNPAAGTSFMILQNDGSDVITGTFNGLPQGATLPGGRFTISYTGGTGNDVVLVAVTPPTLVVREWTGGSPTSLLWSNGDNWNPVGVPQNGDVLVFPAGAARMSNFNNLTNASFQGISITGGTYNISGTNPVALAGGIVVSGTTSTHVIDMPINLTKSQTFQIGKHTLVLDGDIDTNGMGLTFKTTDASSTSMIVVSGVISEGAGTQFSKIGSGRLRLTGNNTTRGNFHVADGVLEVTHASALGSRLGYTSVAAGAQLEITGASLAFNEPVHLTGTLRIADNTGTTALSEPITCEASAEIFVGSTGVVQVNAFDEIVGTALKKSGPGKLVLAGATPKDLSVGFTVAEGTLRVSNTLGVLALPGTTTVGTPTTTGILEIAQSNVTNAGSHLMVHGGGSVVCDASDISFSSLTMAGGSVSTNASGLKLNGPLTTLESATSAVISGKIILPQGASTWHIADGTASVDLQVNAQVQEVVSTDASLTKTGAGKMVLAGANTIDSVTLQEGTMACNGSSPSTTAIVEGGTLSGTGTLGAVFGNGLANIAPGTSPGILPLLSVGALDLSGGGQLVFELNGTTPGTGYDQIVCSGGGASVGLSGGSLDLEMGFSPSSSQTFILLSIAGTGQVTPFPSLPEGAVLVTPGPSGSPDMLFGISYAGGDGNDVTVTRIPQPTGNQRVWTGAVSTLWSNPLNWNIAPVEGDILVFPDSAMRLTPSNDLPAGRYFEKIVFSGAAQYTLTGNKVLVERIEASLSAGIHNIALAMEDRAGIEIISSGAQLNFTQAITLDGGRLTLDSAGIITLSGGLIGQGELYQSGAGTTILSGVNTRTGTTSVTRGELRLSGSGGTAVPGNVTIGGGAHAASLTTTVAHQIADTALVTVATNGTLAIGGTEVIGRLNCDGGLLNNGGNTLAVNGNVTTSENLTIGPGALQINTSAAISRDITVADGKTLTISGLLAIPSAQAGLGLDHFKKGPGTLLIAGDTSPFVVRVDEGTVQVNTSHPSNRPSISLNGGVLNGLGRTKLVSSAAGGTFTPGLGTSSHLWRATGLSLNAATILDLDINGTTAGTGFDQLLIAESGTVSLGSAVLNLRDSQELPVGTVIPIIDNDGTDAVTGIFAGLPGGTTFSGLRNRFTIAYDGGTGNDVTLTVVETPALAFVGSPAMVPSTTNPATFSATVTGPPGAVIKLEASTDLGLTDEWAVIGGPIILDEIGLGEFENIPDPSSAGSSANFYRLRKD